MAIIVETREAEYIFDDANGSSNNGGAPEQVRLDSSTTSYGVTDCGGYYAVTLQFDGDIFNIGTPYTYLEGATMWGAYLSWSGSSSGTARGVVVSIEYVDEGYGTPYTEIIVHTDTDIPIGYPNITLSIKIGGAVTSAEFKDILELHAAIPAIGQEEVRQIVKYTLNNDITLTTGLALPRPLTSASNNMALHYILNLNGNALTGTLLDTVSNGQYYVWWTITDGTLTLSSNLAASTSSDSDVMVLSDLTLSVGGNIYTDEIRCFLFERVKGAVSGSMTAADGNMAIVASQLDVTGSISGKTLIYRSYVNCDSAIDDDVFIVKSNVSSRVSAGGNIAFDTQFHNTDTTAPSSIWDNELLGDGLIMSSAGTWANQLGDIAVTNSNITEANEISDPPQAVEANTGHGGIIVTSLTDKLYQIENTSDPHYYAGVVQPYVFRKVENWDEEFVTYYVLKYGQLKLKEPIEDLIYRVARMVGVQPDVDEKGRETVIDALDAAVQIVCTAYDWNFMRQKTNLEVEQDKYIYDLTEEGTPYPLIDCYRIKSIRYNDDNYSDFLAKRSYQQVEHQIADKDIDTGRPDEYALFTPTKLYLNKKPDADYTLQVIYQRRHPSIQTLKTLLVPDFLVPAIVQLAKEIYKSESSKTTIALLQIPVVQQLIQSAMSQDADIQFDDEGTVPYDQLGELVFKMDL